MLKYFYGEDIYQARQAIQAIADDAHATITWLDRDELSRKPLAEWLGQTTGLFGTQLVVVRDVSGLPKALQTEIITAIDEQKNAPAVFWDRGSPDQRSALFKKLKKVAQKFAFESEGAIVKWLIEQARQKGGVLEPAAAKALHHRVGPDRYRLLNELDQLLLNNQIVTAAHVASALPQPAEAEIFATLAAILQKNKAVALKSVETLLAQGQSEFYLISMLAWQWRTLLQVRQGLDQSDSPEKIVQITHLKPFVVQKSLPLVRQTTTAALLDKLTRILATDFAIKQGKVDARTGLLMLVTSLF